MFTSKPAPTQAIYNKLFAEFHKAVILTTQRHIGLNYSIIIKMIDLQRL